MSKLSLLIFVSLLASISILAQTSVKCVSKDVGTGSPIQGVKIPFNKKNISILTNTNGEFTLSALEAGD